MSEVFDADEGVIDPDVLAEEQKRDWRYEVANGDTVLGFREWVEAQNAATATDPLLPADTVTFNLTRHGGKLITVDLRDGSCETTDEDDLTLFEIDLFRAGEYVTTYNADQLIEDAQDREVIARAAEVASVYVPMLDYSDPD
jgi:hypothetical protein